MVRRGEVTKADMPYLSNEKIEQIAEKVIRTYRSLPQIQGREIRRIDPLLLIDFLGLTVDYQRLSLNGILAGATSSGPDCMIVYDENDDIDLYLLDGKTILIDSALNEPKANLGQRNFALTHEFCHHVLFSLYPKAYRIKEGGNRVLFYTIPSRKPASREELITNRLASAVLMPESLVRSNMLRYGLGCKLKKLNRCFAAAEYEAFSQMAAVMQVSKTALAIRMQQLGLLEQNELANPLKGASIVMDDAEMLLLS